MRIKEIFTKSRIIKTLIFLSATILLCFLFVLIINLNLVGNTKDKISDCEDIDEQYDCIIVLGAGVKSDGSPTHMLEDRLLTAFELYSNGKAPTVFLSGDSHKDGYDEIGSMKSYLVSLGVPEEDIESDGYGLSTYESICRIKEVYGYKNIIIVTQEYHLYRALYIAEKFDLKAVGASADLRPYRKQILYSAREYLARVKDVIYTDLKPLPTYIEAWKEGTDE